VVHCLLGYGWFGELFKFLFQYNDAGVACCNAMKFSTVGATTARSNSGPFSNGPKIHSSPSTFRG
jgi:hypothetical protein